MGRGASNGGGGAGGVPFLQEDVVRLLDAFDTIPVAVLEFDVRLRLLRVNAAGEALLGGHTPSASDSVLTDDNPWLRTHAEEAVRTGGARANVGEFRSSLGNKRLLVTYLPDLDDAGRTRTLLVEVVDITPLVATAAEPGPLQVEASFLQMLGGVLVIGDDGVVLFCNRRAHDLLSIDRGSRVLDTGASGELPALWDPVRRAQSGEVVFCQETTVSRADAGEAVVMMSVTPLFSADGAVVATLALAIDVTARRHAEFARQKTSSLGGGFVRASLSKREVERRIEAQLAQERLLLSSVLSSVEIGVIATDVSGTVFHANEAAHALLGFRPEELIGTNYDDLLFLEDAPHEIGHESSLVEDDVESYLNDLRFVRTDGTVAWVRVRGTLVPIEAPNAQGQIIARLIEDREEERRLTEELRHSDQAIRRAYADVIAAVTGDRLLLLTREELLSRLGEPVTERRWIADGSDLHAVREGLRKVLAEHFPGMPDSDAFVLAVGEASTNALKYAGAAQLQVRRTVRHAQCIVSDAGGGIDFAALPKATLVAGHSTLVGSLGMGFTIMLEVCDSILLATDKGGSTVVLQSTAV